MDWLRSQVLLFKYRLQTAFNYQPQVYPGLITLFRASQVDQLQQSTSLAADQYEAGWQEVSALPLETHSIASYHDTLIEGEAVEILAKHVQTSFDRAEQRVGPTK